LKNWVENVGKKIQILNLDFHNLRKLLSRNRYNNSGKTKSLIALLKMNLKNYNSNGENVLAIILNPEDFFSEILKIDFKINPILYFFQEVIMVAY